MENFLKCMLVILSLVVALSSIGTATMLSNITDRLALLAFKDRIIQDPLGSLNSWNDSLQLCEWRGVTCSREHHRVVALNLQFLGLVGSISPSIGNLSFLRSIYFQDNRFHGNIPPQLGRLFRLQHLNFTNNTLQGEIPENLTHCSALRFIELNFNDLTGKIPEMFGSLSKLTSLTFFSNNLHGDIPPSLGNLSSLQRLSMGSNSLEGTIPDSIGQLTSLRFFGIGVNKLSGIVPPCLYNISSLTDLVIPDNQFTGSLPSDIGLSLPNLRRISVGGNQFTGPFPVSFSNSTEMQILDLSNSTFSGQIPIDLGRRMQNLWWLNVGSNKLGTGEPNELSFLDSLTNCTKLQILGLYANSFGGLLRNSIANLSTQLNTLAAGDNQFVGNMPSGLSNLVNLVQLDFENNFLSGSIPSGIGKLQNLHQLLLNGNELTGSIPASIGNLTQLFRLNLEDNSLTGSISSTFEKIQGLQILNLSYNGLNGSITSIIGSFSTLYSLDLGDNSFNGPLPLEIGNLINLQELDVSQNKLHGEIPSTIGACLRLENLRLEGNLFRGRIPPSLSSLKGIVHLDLSHNNLSGKIPVDLETLPLLENLNLSFNDLEGEVPLKGVFKNGSVISIVGNRELCGGIPEFHLPACLINESKKEKNRLGLIVLVTVASLIVCLTSITVLVIYKWKRKPRKISSSQSSMGDEFLRVSYDDLLKATGGFNSTNLIGAGSFGSVYKGIINPDAKLAAVKVLNLERVGASKSFLAECEALAKTRHRNLVKVTTVCSTVDFEGRDFKALVFEFMLNGSLDIWLHPSVEGPPQERCLNLTQRISILCDIASALEYLHHDCETPIVHCDLKPSNVLLDEYMTAHVGDFGLARFLTDNRSNIGEGDLNTIPIKGSIGYVTPEYGMGSETSTQGDVYSYGILLLETLTGKRPTNEMFNDGLNLHNFCKTALNGNMMEIIDQHLLLEELNQAINYADNPRHPRHRMKECLISLIKIGVACSADSPGQRMDIRDVVVELDVIKEVFLGVGIHGERRIQLQVAGEGTSQFG